MWVVSQAPHKPMNDSADWHGWLQNEDNRHILIQIGSAGLDAEGAAQMLDAMCGGLNEAAEQNARITLLKRHAKVD